MNLYWNDVYLVLGYINLGVGKINASDVAKKYFEVPF